VGAVPQNETRTRRNPFRPAAKRSSVGSRIKLSIFLALIIFIGWISVLVYLPYFTINKVEFSGLKIIKQSEIEQVMKDEFLSPNKYWPRSNYFILRNKKVAAVLSQHYSLSSVNVTKIFPNQLNIYLEEKISTVIYDNGKEYVMLDQEGGIIKYLTKVEDDEIISRNVELNASTTPLATSSNFNSIALDSATASSSPPVIELVHIPNYKKIKSEFGSYPIIYDTLSVSNPSSTIVLPPEVIAGVINFYTQIEKQGIGQIKYIIKSNLLAGMLAKTDKKWDIYFKPTQSISEQINNLKLILRENKPTAYIDLRYGGRVYWK